MYLDDYIYFFFFGHHTGGAHVVCALHSALSNQRTIWNASDQTWICNKQDRYPTSSNMAPVSE